MVKYLTQTEAINIDQELFTTYKYSVDQLMELAGLGCAQVIANTYTPTLSNRILIGCGPGNNGGDGLVCARHLKLFGYNVDVHYPRRTQSQLYANLTAQCEAMGVRFVDDFKEGYDVLVDALFGFSFKPPVRPQFVPIVEFLKKTTIPIVR